MRRSQTTTVARISALLAFATTAAIAGSARSQDAARCAGCGEEGLMVVPPADRLHIGRVFADASLEVKAVFAILLVAAIAAVVVWAMSLGKVRQGDAKGLAGALGRLKIVRSAGVPLGALAASYILFSGFLGIANVRPAPSVTVLAPGWAEAALAVMLGLLASTVGVLCERHLEARIRRAAA